MNACAPPHLVRGRVADTDETRPVPTRAAEFGSQWSKVRYERMYRRSSQNSGPFGAAFQVLVSVGPGSCAALRLPGFLAREIYLTLSLEFKIQPQSSVNFLISHLEEFVLRTICGDACPLSCVSAEACLTGWTNARGRRDGGIS